MSSKGEFPDICYRYRSFPGNFPLVLEPLLENFGSEKSTGTGTGNKFGYRHTLPQLMFSLLKGEIWGEGGYWVPGGIGCYHFISLHPAR